MRHIFAVTGQGERSVVGVMVEGGVTGECRNCLRSVSRGDLWCSMGREKELRAKAVTDDERVRKDRWCWKGEREELRTMPQRCTKGKEGRTLL